MTGKNCVNKHNMAQKPKRRLFLVVDIQQELMSADFWERIKTSDYFWLVLKTTCDCGCG